MHSVQDQRGGMWWQKLWWMWWQSPKTYTGFQCKLRPPWCTVYCGFKHPSDKTGILGFYYFYDCHLFSLFILLERGQERDLATILTENLCMVWVLSQEKFSGSQIYWVSGFAVPVGGGKYVFPKIAFCATEISRTKILSRVKHLSCFVFSLLSQQQRSCFMLLNCRKNIGAATMY